MDQFILPPWNGKHQWTDIRQNLCRSQDLPNIYHHLSFASPKEQFVDLLLKSGWTPKQSVHCFHSHLEIFFHPLCTKWVVLVVLFWPLGTAAVPWVESNKTRSWPGAKIRNPVLKFQSGNWSDTKTTNMHWSIGAWAFFFCFHSELSRPKNLRKNADFPEHFS